MNLYRIEEYPEIWADACLRDSEGRFMFLSLYGRDGSLMQFLAAMELGESERGVQRFHLQAADGQRHLVDVGGAQRLAKHAGKLPRQNLFGPLNHLWVFDKSLQTPDQANRIGWALHSTAAGRQETTGLADRVWQLINALSPVALQDHWREPVLSWCRNKGATQLMDSSLYPALGPVQAMRVSLTDHFTAFISQEVRQRRLLLT
ncbi:MAG: hypothetical protein FWG56_09865 [Desulfovibrionaceae bacterium]|nr:hypothetical protein [Desulfovibrionaceae bacterium]